MLNKLRLLTPGPTPLPETVRLALAQDMIHHRKKEFVEIMLQVQNQLHLLFGTSQPVLPLACSGTGAMTAAAYSLFNPGEKVLVIEAGKFGQRWREICKSRKLEVKSIEIEWGKVVSPDQILKALEQDKGIKGVFLQLCETSTGVLQPVKDIAAKLATLDVLLVVDGISAVGISPCPMDSWGLDCLLTGSQKGLMLPPGLALLSFSDKAWHKAENVSQGCFYFNMLKEKENLMKGQTLFTSPVNLIVALKASMDLILQNGLDLIYSKQWALTMLIRKGCQALGLEPLAKENFAWGLTSICLPENIDGVELLKRIQAQYGICLAGGQDQLKGRIIRIGHMGWIDWGDCVAALSALASILAGTANLKLNNNFIDIALEAYNEALNGPAGIY